MSTRIISSVQGSKRGLNGGPVGGTQLPPIPGDQPGKPRMMKSKTIRERNNHKVRVHLPPIESYQKELEFPADGPGRVVVRLERLMGSDRVRLTDTKYMATLLERLEEQERLAWTKRRLGRIKTERNRYRQLAIDGLMEPGPDMQDLYYHPVFRVNRILNRLSKMDNNITLTPTNKLPPITQVDPFQYDDNGREFRNYPGHVTFQDEELSEVGSSRLDLYKELMGKRPTSSSQMSKTSKMSKMLKISKMSKKYFEAGEYEGEGYEEEMIPRSNHTVKSSASSKHHRVKTATPSQAKMSSLTAMQQQYGVEPVHDLNSEWEPFRSHLVDMVFQDESDKIQDLYEVAEGVLGVYTREQQTSDDFVIKLNRML